MNADQLVEAVSKKLVLKKYYQDKEEIEKFKEEKNKMNKQIENFIHIQLYEKLS